MLRQGARFAGGRGHALAVLFLCAVATAAFFPVVRGSRSFLHWDLFYEHVPIWTAVQKALLAGESPFWLDGEYAGNPLLYTQEAPVFYPLTAPLLLTGLPANRAADLFTLVHVLVAGLLAYALAREVGARGAPALFAGTAWMLSARTVQSAIWPNAVTIAALLPLLVLGLIRIGRGVRRSGVLLSAAGGGLMLLASRPQAVVGAVPILAAVALFALVSAPRKTEAARDLALATLLAAALGAPSVLPTLLLHSQMDRAAGLSAAERNVDAIAPARDLDLVFLPRDGRGRFPEAACYPGVAAGLLFIGGLALFARRADPERALFLAVTAGGAVGLAFAFGDRGPYRILSWLPILRDLHVPARYLLSWAFAVALGAGLAASALSRRGRAGRGVVIGALILLVPDLAVHARRAAPTADAEHYRATPAILARIASEPPDESGFPRRFWTTGVGLPDRSDPRVSPSWAAAVEPLSGAAGIRWGVEGLEGRGPSLLRVRRLLDSGAATVPRLAGAFRIVSEMPGLPFVRDAAPDPPTWRVLDALPRAWLVPGAIAVPEGLALGVALSPSFDPSALVVVEGAAPPPPADWGSGRGAVRLIARRGGEVVLRLSAPGPGWLVLADAFEEGWGADVDGVAAPVFPANGVFRAVPIGPGEHRVAFRYKPRGLTEGLLLGAAGLLGMLLAYRRISALA